MRPRMKRILMVNGENLLIAAVESLLSREKDICILNTRSQNGEADLKAISKFQPQVIILDETLPITFLNCLLDLMVELPELVIIVVQLRSNHVHLYEKRTLQIKQSSDITSAIL